jgi:hypothetical protein
MNSITLFALFCVLSTVFADTFIHGCMEGSNNKLNEENGNSNRNNANRLFDSQNGAGGGYYTNPASTGVAKETDDPTFYRKYYYVGSQLHLQWVNQHGSGDNVYIRTNFVWQYMCDNMGGGSATPWSNVGMRDGTTTDTIGNSDIESQDLQYGRHEPYAYYNDCENRDRNAGLYISDQNLNAAERAIHTRQERDGTRHGYECTEERDYYPYWHPTPFVDIVYLTSQPDAKDAGGCDSIKKNSFNVRSYNHCVGNQAANNEADCKAAGAEWKSFGPWSDHYDFVSEPECQESHWSRENHLGFGRNGQMNTYNWTIPNNPGAICILRERYNMTQGEIPWDLDYKANGDRAPVQERNGNGDNTNDRVDNYAASKYPGVALQIGVNSDQFGRTFQDRTHTFAIRERPTDVDDRAIIYNLGNKGGRGNLQNIYPMVENDFCPEVLVARAGDYVHFQLHGPNYGQGFNRNNAGGAGRTGGNRANRVNIVQIKDPAANYPMRIEDQTMFDDQDTAIRAAFLDQNPDDCNPNSTGEQSDDNCSKLNATDNGYLDLGLLRLNSTGTFYYMSSRNNINTNRAQKGTLIVEPALSWVAILLIVLASILAVGGAAVGILAHQSKANPGGRAAALWDRLASAGGSSFGGSYRY